MLAILRGERSLEDEACRLGLPVEQLESWRNQFLAAAEDAIRTRSTEARESSDDAEARVFAIWVCATGRQLLSPYLFMSAAFPGSPMQPATAYWLKGCPPPERLTTTGSLELLSTRGPVDRTTGRVVELYAAMEPITKRLESLSALADWRLPHSSVEGIVLLLTGPHDPRPERRPCGRLRFAGNRTVAWVKAQGLPFVVGAMGDDSSDSSETRLRQRCALPPGAPILAGPPLVRTRPLVVGSSTGHLQRGPIGARLSTLVTGGVLQFDRGYAANLMQALYEAVSTGR